MSRKWKREETVAAKLRAAAKMVVISKVFNIERQFFAAHADVVTLEGLRLRLKSISDDAMVTKLLTVEISDI